MIKVTAYDFQDVHQTDGDLVVAFYGRSTLFHLFGKKDREEYADSIIKALLKYSPRDHRNCETSFPSFRNSKERRSSIQ